MTCGHASASTQICTQRLLKAAKTLGRMVQTNTMSRGESKIFARVVVVAMVAALIAGCGGAVADRSATPGDRAPIDHIIVLYMENRSFDHLFGTYPGADGIANYRGRQENGSGVPYPTLPAPIGRDGNFLLHLLKKGELQLDVADEVTAGALITRGGEIVDAAVRSALSA